MSYVSSILEILFVDALLSGDNAAVIAMATSNLPCSQRVFCVRLGVGLAILIRIVTLFLVSSILSYPGLGAIGGLILLGVGISFSPSKPSAHKLPKKLHPTSVLSKESATENKNNGGFFSALQKIVIIDFVMSIDNVVGVASIAGTDKFLLIFGVLASIPMMLFFSDLILRLLNRYSYIFWIGVAFMGFVGGRLIGSDFIFKETILNYPSLKWIIPIVSAVLLTTVRYLMEIFIREEEGT